MTHIPQSNALPPQTVNDKTHKLLCLMQIAGFTRAQISADGIDYTYNRASVKGDSAEVSLTDILYSIDPTCATIGALKCARFYPSLSAERRNHGLTWGVYDLSKPGKIRAL
jgi:hypothetical protein